METIYDSKQILAILPHRYPFVMVDRIVECDGKEWIVGLKNVSSNEPCFQGHFPGDPVFPGVLQLEAMAQTAGVLLKAAPAITWAWTTPASAGSSVPATRCAWKSRCSASGWAWPARTAGSWWTAKSRAKRR